MYEQGSSGVLSKDVDQAVEWYRKAVQNDKDNGWPRKQATQALGRLGYEAPPPPKESWGA